MKLAYLINIENLNLKSFNDALLIWIRKPHVVNRSFCGADIVCCTRLDKKKLKSFNLELYIVNKSALPRYLNLVLNELVLKRIENVDCDLKDATYDVYVRHQISKNTKKKGVYELILHNPASNESYFSLLCSDDECDTKRTEDDFADLIYKISISDDEKTISLHINENYPVTSKPSSYALSLDWLKNTLLAKIVSWSQEKDLNTNIKSLILVSVNEYNKKYNMLKDKYGTYFVEIWTENTDPLKYVYEDIGIAAYLLLIWEKFDKNIENECKCFVDVGCGNGLLVYILNSEGHSGYGVDVRNRKIWESLMPTADLRVQTVIPTEENLFSDADWLIGNHSDELTPWIPVMAARSANRKCQYFVIPCCPWDFTEKFSHAFESGNGTGKYDSYLNFINEVGVVCGFNVHKDVLRIPSTRRTCFVGLINDNGDTCREKKLLRINEYIASRQKLSNSNNSGCFKPRESVEKIRNGLGIDRKLIETIWLTVLKELLKTEDYAHQNAATEYETDQDSRALVEDVAMATDSDVTRETKCSRKWNRGGLVSLSELSKSFSKDILSVLKCECGGLQTILKNCPDVFSIRGGNVSLRDWTSEEFNEYINWRKNKNFTGGAKNIKDSKKTKMCFYYANHPDGCPLSDSECRFAHGSSDLNYTNKL